MTKIDYIHTRKDGEICHCYGDISRDDNNFSIVCDDEMNDTVWCDGNPNAESGVFSSWQAAANFFESKFPDVSQIEAV